MKHAITAFVLFFLAALPLLGQSTTVSGTITDTPDGQAWFGGTYSFVFRVSPSNPTAQYFWNGAPFSSFQTIAGSLDGSAHYSVSIPSNTSITPAGSTWDLTVCPLATASCLTVRSISLTGPTQTVQPIPPSIRINLTSPPPNTRGYTDAEMVNGALGQSYYNIVDTTIHVCNATPCGWVPFGGGGGGSPSQGSQGIIQGAGSAAGTFQVSNLRELNGSLTIDDDAHFKGPNPYVDASRYGVRASVQNATPNIPGVTATISGGSLGTAIISTNACASQTPTTCFQKGDAVTVFGAGAATGLSTPAAPTVTPYNTIGATNSGLGVASPTASTAYQFCLSAVGLASQTACSSFTSISNGQATLGPITSSVSSATLLNNTMSVVTSSTLPVSPLATCQVYGMSPPSYNYEGQISTITGGGTTLNFNTSSDTRNGAVATATTNGTVVCWNSVHVKAAALPTGGTTSTRIAVYGGAGSATNFLGFMNPVGNLDPSDLTYLVFDWYGATFSPSIRPFYISATAPVSATNESFNTTLTNVSGTTLTFASNATTAVTGATILLDQATNINTCLGQSSNGGSSTCRLPSTTAGYYVLNSQLNIPNNTVLDVAGANGSGGIWANDTILFQGTSGDILGRPASNQQNSTSFNITHYSTIDCGNAWPCMASLGKAKLDLVQVNIPDGGLGFFQGQSNLIPGYDWNYVYWNHTGSNSYGSIAYYCAGNHVGNGGITNSTFHGMNFSAQQLGLGSMQTPTFISNGCGGWSFPETFFSGKGRFWRPPTTGMAIDINTLEYSQANYMPYDTIYNTDGGNISIGFTLHGPFITDTTFAPMVATNSGITLTVTADNAAPSNSVASLVTGAGPIYIAEGATQGINSVTGQNTNLCSGPSPAVVADPVLGYATKAAMRCEADQSVGPLYSIHTRELPPTAPTCPITSGGSVPIAAHVYQYAFVYPDGGQGTPSQNCAATTTTGNQTVTVTAPTGAIGYAFYRDGVLANGPSCNVFQSFSNVFVDTFSFNCANAQPNWPASGPAGMRGTKSWSQQSTAQSLNLFPTTGLSNPTIGGLVSFNSANNGLKCVTSAGNNCFGMILPATYAVNHTLNINESDVTATATLTFTLPHALSTWGWNIESVSGTTTLAIDSGNLYVGGAIGSITIPNSQGVHAWCDGTNCYAFGLGSGGGGGSPGGALNAFQYNGGGGSFGGVNSPVVNGNYNIHYRVTASASVPPSIDNPGVPINTQTGTTYTIGTANTDFDRGYRITANNAGAQTYTFVNPSTAGYGFNHYFIIQNIGTGTVTATSSGFNINGGTTLLIAPSWTVFFWSDGVNYFASRLPDFTAFPNCVGGGNALQFTTATGVFSCGASSSGVSSLTDGTGLFTASGATGSVTLAYSTELANKVLGNCTGSTAVPSFCSITDAMLTAASHAALFNAGNTWTGFQDFSGATWKIPTAGGFTAGASTMFGYDSTNKNCHVYANNADGICGAFASAPANNSFVIASVSSSNVLLTGVASPQVTTQTAKDNSTNIASTAYVDRPTGLTAGTSVTLTAPRQYFICTGACTITVPVPAAGYEFCVRNDNNVTSVITFAAIGSSSRYENTSFTGYGTAGTGTLVSGGAAGDKMCLLGRDATHYLVASFNGVWTAN